LTETTLLFLSNLKSIRWNIDGEGNGEVFRQEHSDHHIEVLKRKDGKVMSSSHFLRFSNPVEGLEKQNVSIAFSLDFLPTFSSFHAATALAKQLKIVPATPGRVAVFFPAEKETSGLRFHIHAPFVPELSRASIKETPANLPLFQQLETLAAQSLHRIRDLELLTPEFLGVLPNSFDSLHPRYQCIRTAIVREMNSQPLTPTHAKSFAPAKHLLQARAMLKDFLSLDDIEFLVDYDEVAPQWAVGATQKNSNVDRFLTGLAIGNWDVDELVRVLTLKASNSPRHIFVPEFKHIPGPDSAFMSWLSAKAVEWHQQLYAVLHTDLQSRSEHPRFSMIAELKQLRIVRLCDGTYSTGACYFPTEGAKGAILPRVDAAVYLSGKSKTQQQEAKSFLVAIGVREIVEVDEIRAILQQRYTKELFAPDLKDLECFVALVEKEPTQAKIFSDYYIFQREDGKWGKPSQLYLDSPFLQTGLTAYHGGRGAKADRAALATSYQMDSTVSLDRIVKFATSVGVQTRLEIQLVRCHDNPSVDHLVYASNGGWSDNYGVNQDYAIEGLRELLANQSEPLCRLVWTTLCEIRDPFWLKARYRNNSQHPYHESDSQVVCILREMPWVPQTNGTFVPPAKASRDLLPSGFPFDSGYKWLFAVGFEKDSQQRIEETKKQESTAKALGFCDAATLDRAKQFATLPPQEQERILAEFEKRQQSPLPQSEPRNPHRRAEKLREQAEDAPERIVEKRVRSVSVGREDVKKETEQYLVQQYTNELGELFCQVCQAPLPFKLEDGGYYFEKVEFLAELKRRHLRNYLCLCPNHSAMFQYANGSKNVLKTLFVEMAGERMEIILAQANASIYFTKTHIADLRTAIEADSAELSESTSR